MKALKLTLEITPLHSTIVEETTKGTIFKMHVSLLDFSAFSVATTAPLLDVKP